MEEKVGKERRVLPVEEHWWVAPEMMMVVE